MSKLKDEDEFKDDLKESEKEDQGHWDVSSLIQVTKTLNPLYILIRANSFLGGKVYFRVDGEQIPAEH